VIREALCRRAITVRRPRRDALNASYETLTVVNASFRASPAGCAPLLAAELSVQEAT
jgi:hypothetical protein